jgi:hypothetical protein
MYTSLAWCIYTVKRCRICTSAMIGSMPNKPATPNRAVRIDDETWAALGTAAEAAGTDRSAILRGLAQWWLRAPGARVPARPDAGTGRDQNGTTRRGTREDDAGRAGTENGTLPG